MTNELIEKIEDKWTNVQLDSQLLSVFMECPRKFDYVFNRNLVPIQGVSKAIQKGKLAHYGIQEFHQSRINGKSYSESVFLSLEECKKKALGTDFNNLEAKDSLSVYETLTKFFEFNKQSIWMPLAVEKHFRFLAFEDPSLKLRIYLCGRIDLIVRNPQQPILPVDNKTESERWFYSSLSNQFRIYALACKTYTLGLQRVGFQETVAPEKKYEMQLISFDPDALEEFRTETLPYYAKELLIKMEDGYWPMNHKSCITGHFACQFSDKYNGGICNISRNVREDKLIRYFKVGESWNPEKA